MTYLGISLALLVAAVLTQVARRLHRRRAAAVPELDDDDVRRIIEDGVIGYDTPDPLDQAEIDEAERQFWIEERWDEGEEW